MSKLKNTHINKRVNYRTTKHTITYLFVALTLSITLIPACQDSENCPTSEIVSVPQDYDVKLLNRIVSPNELSHLQFIDNNLGFMLAGDDGIMKTVDGGQNWDQIHTVDNETQMALLFVDEQTGYIPLYSDTASVQLIKTSDGGLTWNKIEYPTIKGRIYRITKDADNTLYATIRSGDQPSLLIKSVDGAQTWEVINNFNLSYGYTFSVHSNKLYIGSEDVIIVCDTFGQVIKTIQMPIQLINTLVVLDDDNLIAGTDEQTIKTTDGGENWVFLNSEKEFHRIISFSDTNTGLMFFKRVCSESDYGKDIFTFESTTSSGDEWGAASDLSLLWDIYSMDVVRKGEKQVLISLLSTTTPNTWVLYEINKE